MALSANQLEIIIKARDTATAVVKKVSTNMSKLGTIAKNVGKKMTSAFAAVGKSIFSLKTGFVALAGAAGMAFAIKQTYSYIDALGKTSRKLGVAAEELQRLRYAANRAGIETGTMDMALQRFTRRAAEAAKGTGEAKDALAQMGIKLTGTNGRMNSTEQLLGQVAEAFKKVKDPSEKLRLAFKLFDSEGVAMVNMLNGGKAGLKDMTTQAQNLGFVLSENTIKGVERANDAMLAMTSAMGGVWDKLTASLAPALEAFGGWWAVFVAQFSRAIQPAIEWINSNLKAMTVDFGTAAQMGAEWGKTVGDWIVKMVEWFKGLFAETDKNTSITKQFADAWTSITEWWDKDGKNMWREMKSTISAIGSAISFVVNTIQMAINGLKALYALASGKGLNAAANIAKGGTATPTGTRASGGGVQANKPYLVGERGPEMFTPNKTGSIAANTGSTTIVNNIYTAATAHGINNALASRGDSAARSTRVGMTVSGSRSTSAFGNVSGVRR